MPKARIVIVAYKSGPDLQRCVNALAQQSCREFEVVIVDNDTPDDCITSLKLPDKRFSVITAGANLGFAGGSNLGAKGAACDWIITLNPDAFAHPNWLAELMKTGQIYPQVSMISSVVIQDENPKLLDSCGDNFSIYGIAWQGGFDQSTDIIPKDDVLVFGASGAAAAYRREQFERHSGFDEQFFCYLEDVDLALRIRMAGGQCLLSPRAIVRHIGSSSTQKNSAFQHEHTARNNVRLIMKNMPYILLVIMVPLFILSQFWIGFRIRKQKYFGAKLRGLKRGIVEIPSALKARKQGRKRQISLAKLCRILVWSPLAVSKRRVRFW